MSLNLVLGVLAALGISGSLLVMYAGWTGAKIPSPASKVARIGKRWTGAQRRQFGVVAAVAVVVLLLTRWPVAAIAAAFVAWLWPTIRATYIIESKRIERLDALATWTESLRDTIAGTMGLEQAITSSAAIAQPAIRAQLDRLVGQLRSRQSLRVALADLGEDLADPDADELIAALALNSTLRGPGLQATLTELADVTRERLSKRRAIDEGRRSLRRSSLAIIGIIVIAAIAMVVFNRPFVAAYSTPLGQLALVIIMGIWAAGFFMIKRAVEGKERPRFLGNKTKVVSA